MAVEYASYSLSPVADSPVRRLSTMLTTRNRSRRIFVQSSLSPLPFLSSRPFHAPRTDTLAKLTTQRNDYRPSSTLLPSAPPSPAFDSLRTPPLRLPRPHHRSPPALSLASVRPTAHGTTPPTLRPALEQRPNGPHLSLSQHSPLRLLPDHPGTRQREIGGARASREEESAHGVWVLRRSTYERSVRASRDPDGVGLEHQRDEAPGGQVK